MIIDNHVHVGWYRDGYHSPKEIWEAETAAVTTQHPYRKLLVNKA